jgi:hypothetical protein
MRVSHTTHIPHQERVNKTYNFFHSQRRCSNVLHQWAVHCDSRVEIPQLRFHIFNMYASARVKNKLGCFILNLGAPAPLTRVIFPSVVHRATSSTVGIPHGTPSVLQMAQRVRWSSELPLLRLLQLLLRGWWRPGLLHPLLLVGQSLVFDP